MRALAEPTPGAGEPAGAPGERPRGIGRWIVYQRERFPLLAHGPLIAAFSAGAVCFSVQLRGATWPPAGSLAVAFLSCLLFFFQLRVSDELKDAEEDARYRPYRAVPRGLVTLRELTILGIAAMAVQLLLALWLSPRLVLPLVVVWAFIGLMTKEFWLREWLARRPLTVLWTHMLIMPLIDLYATACDWLVAGAPMVAGLRWFLVASFCNGIVIEVGRKVRAPDDEEHGVPTYTAIWGRPRTIAVWLGAMGTTYGCAIAAAQDAGAARVPALVLGVLLAGSIAAGARFVAVPASARASLIPVLSGVWTVLMYVSVGILPLLLRR